MTTIDTQAMLCWPCKLEVRTEGRTLCAGFDQHLNTTTDGMALRCWQCIGSQKQPTKE